MLAYLLHTNCVATSFLLASVLHTACTRPASNESGDTTYAPALEQDRSGVGRDSKATILPDADLQGKPPVQPSDPVLTWYRDGGIAGFCDELKVSSAGQLRITSCKSPATRTGRLSSEDLDRLRRWAALFGSVVIESRDSPAADAMTLRLTLKGIGGRQPSAEDRLKMLEWAQDVYGRHGP